MFEMPESADSPARPTGAAAGRGTSPVIEVVAGFGHDQQRWVEQVVIPRAVEQLDEPPGSLLAAAVEDAGVRLGEPSDEEVLRLIAATDRLVSWAQAVQAEAIAELVRRPGMNPDAREALDGRTLTIAEIAPELGLTRHSATRRVDVAEHLAVRFPATLTALREGRIDKARAEVIADELGAVPDLPVKDRDAIERLALEGTPARTRPQLRDVIRRALLSIKPADAAERHQKARRGRCVRTDALTDGMGELWSLLPAETITTIDTVLNGLADRAAAGDGGDPRTHDQRRADVLGDIFTSILDGLPVPCLGTAVPPSFAKRSDPAGPADPAGLSPSRAGECRSGCGFGECGAARWWLAPPLPMRKRRRPHLVITIAASTLAGTDDQPATLAGYGPVPADLARQLASQAGTAQTACVDPDTGACQWIGRVTPYRPSQAILDQVIARDPICRHPGCRRPATQCDVDHVERHPAGPTCVCNLISLCRAHHRCKHNGGWRVELATSRNGGAVSGDPPRTVIWTSPLGRRHTDAPVPLMPPAPRSPSAAQVKSGPPPTDPPF